MKDRGEFDAARKLYKSLLPALGDARDKTSLGRALNELSAIDSALGDYEQALESASEAASLCRQLGDGPCEARALNGAGVASLYRGDYPAALDKFQQSLRMTRLLGDLEGEVLRRNNVGNVYYFQGRYLQALRHYQTALEQVKERDSEPWSSHARQVSTANLATLLQRLGRDEIALALYQTILSPPHKLSPSEEARVLANLGALYRNLGDPVKALETYRRAETLFSREHHVDGELGVRKNIGIALAVDLADLPRAEEAFAAVLKIASASSNAREVMQTRLYQGEVWFRMGLVVQAQNAWELALAEARRLGTTEEQWKALYGLGRIAERRGNEALALSRYDQAVVILESVRARLQRLL